MMAEEEEKPVEAAVPQGVGPQLRTAREKLGMTTLQVAEETRISLRHIESIEAGDFSDLPGRIYAIGFAKTFAKVVGLDQADVAAMVRAEMGAGVAAGDTRSQFEPGDPTRGPGRMLVWFSLFAAVLLLAGLYALARELFAPAAQLPSLIVQEEAEQKAALAAQQAAEVEAAQEIDATGMVVFTAQGPAWVRFTDAQGHILMEQEMMQGASFTVPADADGPKIITGRPDLLEITIGGRSVPKISEEPVTVVDISVSAAALLARETPAAADEASPNTAD